MIKLDKLNEPESERLISDPVVTFLYILGCLTIPADAFLMSACDGVKVPLPALCSSDIFLSHHPFASSGRGKPPSIPAVLSAAHRPAHGPTVAAPEGFSGFT